MDIVTILSLTANVIFAIIAATRAVKHFRGRVVIDWLSKFNTQEFLKADQIVFELVEENDSSTLVKRIRKNPKNMIAVTHVLSFALQAAISAKQGLMDKDTLMRYTVFIVPYYWKKLQPWIETRQKETDEEYFYKDIGWLADEIDKNKKRMFSDPISHKIAHFLKSEIRPLTGLYK